MNQKVVTNDKAVTRNFFSSIFDTFERYVTNLRGALVDNVKQVQNQPSLVNCTLFVLAGE
jgi:hypothetical protein